MKLKKFFYYFLNLVWGLPLTMVGLIAALMLVILGYKPHKWGGCIYFNVGNYWGGMNLGLVFITDKQDDPRVKNHEYGHSLQNAVLGPLMIFLVAIPSFIRYWIFEFRYRLNMPNKDYDAIWFEGQATRLGNNTVNYWNKIC